MNIVNIAIYTQGHVFTICLRTNYFDLLQVYVDHIKGIQFFTVPKKIQVRKLKF